MTEAVLNTPDTVPKAASLLDDSVEGVPDAATVARLRQAVASRLRGSTADTEAERARIIGQEVTSWAQRQVAAGSAPVSETYEHRLFTAVLAALSGLGGLQPLLDRTDVENIHLHGHDRVFVELADGSLQRWPHPVADSDEALLELLGDMFARQGQTSREFSPARPIGNLRLAAGGPLGARLAAVREVTDRPRVAIRRHRLTNTTLDDLLEHGTLDAALHRFLSTAVQAGLNLLVTGGPAAGKTTLLRALSHVVGPSEHLITVEDEYELGLHLDQDRHPLVTPMEARAANAEGVGEVGLDALLKQALRHSPSRVLVGEVRAGEITALLRALGNGAAGGMGTLHATSAAAVPDRIAALGQLATPPLAIDAAHRWSSAALDLIVHVTRRDTSRGGRPVRERFVTEICEVGPVGDADRPDLTTLFAPRPADGRAVPACPPSPALMNRLATHGLDRALFDHTDAWPHYPSGGTV